VSPTAFRAGARVLAMSPKATAGRPASGPPACCPLYHEAVELIGRRWTGAIVSVLLDSGPLRFSQIAQAVPDLSDRLLSERLKDLEANGVVERHVDPGPPLRIRYALTAKGRSLEPAVVELRAWAQRWIT
jgi:DNA-binding HxlR family transcriptional regulator